MESDKNKIKEPFPPENTPNPPQIIDPNKRNEEPEKAPLKTGKGPSGKGKPDRENQKPASLKKEEKVAEEPESEITGETSN